jgi:hypothetical protein
MFLIEVISWAAMLAIMPTSKSVVNYANRLTQFMPMVSASPAAQVLLVQ